MPVTVDIMPDSPGGNFCVSSCFMQKFLLFACALGLLFFSGFTEREALAAPGQGEPLKFAPPPVDLNFNRDGPKQDATPVQTQTRANLQADAAGTGARQGSSSAAQSAHAGSDANQTDQIRLFGTVEFRGAIKKVPKWERVLSEENKQPTFPKYKENMPANVRPRWEALVASQKDKPLKEQLQQVNNFFNQWPYKKDIAVWGVEDYWATPAEFMKKSGDCEDYAIAKYYALRDLGIPASQMRIAGVMDTLKNIGHAVLVVYVDDDALVLDSVTNLILSHKRLTQYQIKFSMNEEYLWRHVKPVR